MDVEKKIEFILDQQAQFFADLAAQREHLTAELAAQREHFTAELAAQKEQMGELRNHLGQFQDLMMTWVNRIEGLAQKRDERMDHLTENMNALVKVVDGLVRRDNGGRIQ